MEVPGLGVKSELQLLAYIIATATPDPSCICNLHHSSQQCQILNPLNEARVGTCVLMDSSPVHYYWATMGSPFFSFLKGYFVFIEFLGYVDLQFSSNIEKNCYFLKIFVSSISEKQLHYFILLYVVSDAIGSLHLFQLYIFYATFWTVLFLLLCLQTHWSLLLNVL